MDHQAHGQSDTAKAPVMRFRDDAVMPHVEILATPAACANCGADMPFGACFVAGPSGPACGHTVINGTIRCMKCVIDGMVAAGEIVLDLRTGQTPPPGDWEVWLLLGGRGAGKDFAGQAWIRSQVEKGAMDLVVVVPGREHVEDAVQGLYSAFPAGQRPSRTRIAGRRTLLFSSGPAVMFYDSTDPDALPDSCGAAWGNDLVQWANPEAALHRLRQAATGRGGRGRILLTTTPGDSINDLLNELLADRTVVSTSIRTSENTALDPAFARRMQEKYGNTAIGRQELDGVVSTEPARAS